MSEKIKDTTPAPREAEAEMPRSHALQLVRQADEAVRAAAVAVCWEQWRSLGAFGSAHGSRPAQSIVDPEALVLLSLIARDHERRLDDFLGWWAAAGASLLSVQRMHNLAGRFSGQATRGLRAFARLAAQAGDRRWKRHQGDDDALSPRQGKGADQLALLTPTALVLRLRAGFGVGAKADLLAFLLGLQGRRASTREAAEALGYTEVAVRAAAQEMTLAGFVEETPGRPARYAADLAAWQHLLKTTPATGAPESELRWRHWVEVFAFLAAVQAWAAEGQEAHWSPYVWSSRARDLAERHRQPLDAARLRLPDPRSRHGTAYLDAFAASTEHIAKWVQQNL